MLAERSDQVVSLVGNTNALLAQLRTQSAALDQISGNISALASSCRVSSPRTAHDCRPALDKLNGVLTIVDNRKERLQKSLKLLNAYAMSLGESVASGPFFKAYVANLLPGQFLQPFIDAAFSDLGLDPNVLLPSQLTDPQIGQPGTRRCRCRTRGPARAASRGSTICPTRSPATPAIILRSARLAATRADRLLPATGSRCRPRRPAVRRRARPRPRRRGWHPYPCRRRARSWCPHPARLPPTPTAEGRTDETAFAGACSARALVVAARRRAWSSLMRSQRHRSTARIVVAYFDNSNGIFVGDDVRILGRERSARSTRSNRSRNGAKISFWFDSKYKVPADAKAAILSPTAGHLTGHPAHPGLHQRPHAWPTAR